MARSTANFELPNLHDASPQPHYNTAAVVRLTGVPAATFRAWERRYGFPLPRRLPAGQRLYSDQDVAAIRWLHEQTERGLTISRAVALIREVLASGQVRPVAAAGRPTAELADELLAALLATDQRRAEAVLAEAFALYSVETVTLEIFQPLQIEVGERWHRNELSVAEEHYISNFLLRKLLGLINAYDGGRGRGLIVAACGPDEWHEFGVLIVALFLVRRGHRVLYLGPNLPLDDLARQIGRLQPDLVCFSASTAETADTLIRSARGLVPQANGTVFGFGGRAFNHEPALARAAPGAYLGRDATEAVEIVERLVSSNGRAR